jgi:hypothetical protein
MKKLIFGIIMSLSLLSCKSSKDCGCYSYVVDVDTVTIVTEHINYDGICQESTTYRNVITDTLVIKTN